MSTAARFMPAPEAYVGGVAAKYDGDRLVDDASRAFFQSFIDSFAGWVERHAR